MAKNDLFSYASFGKRATYNICGSFSELHRVKNSFAAVSLFYWKPQFVQIKLFFNLVECFVKAFRSKVEH